MFEVQTESVFWYTQLSIKHCCYANDIILAWYRNSKDNQKPREILNKFQWKLLSYLGSDRMVNGLNVLFLILLLLYRKWYIEFSKVIVILLYTNWEPVMCQLLDGHEWIILNGKSWSILQTLKAKQRKASKANICKMISISMYPLGNVLRCRPF